MLHFFVSIMDQCMCVEVPILLSYISFMIYSDGFSSPGQQFITGTFLALYDHKFIMSSPGCHPLMTSETNTQAIDITFFH